MNDPHIVALNYRIEHETWIDWPTAETLELREDAFDVRVEDMHVRFRMKAHHTTEQAARDAVEDYIRAWVLDAALRHGSGAFRLRFVHSEIVDRNPTPGTMLVRSGSPTATFAGVIARIPVSPSFWPAPPAGLRSNPDVERMLRRYAGSRDRREPLTAMEYFCLTVLEASAGSRRNAAR